MLNSTPFSSPNVSSSSLHSLRSQSNSSLRSQSNSSSNLSIFSAGAGSVHSSGGSNSSTPTKPSTPNGTPLKISSTWKNISTPNGYNNREETWSIMPKNLPLYHPLNVLGQREGYYPNLSQQQVLAVSLLKKMLIENETDFYDDGEYEYFKLLRFLRARKFDVNEAYTLLINDIEWRTYTVGLDLKYECAENILNCDIAKVIKQYPAFIQGVDKQMRPVCYRPGSFKMNKLLELTTFDDLIRFHAWESEQALKIMSKQTQLTGYNIETFVVIVDAREFSLNLATTDAISFIKSMSAVDSNHYPERLGCCLIINAPFMLSLTWSVIETFLDSVTKAKIKIMSGPGEWQPVLFSLIEKDQIPMMYGGTARDPDIYKSLIDSNDDNLKARAELRRPISLPPQPPAPPPPPTTTAVCEVESDKGVFESILGENFWWVDVPITATVNLFTINDDGSNKEDKSKNNDSSNEEDKSKNNT